jgi:hypothetical protein
MVFAPPVDRPLFGGSRVIRLWADGQAHHRRIDLWVVDGWDIWMALAEVVTQRQPNFARQDSPFDFAQGWLWESAPRVS